MTDSALKALYISYQRELQAYLTSKLRDPELAADLTQETFVRYAERSTSDSADILNIRSYLYRTAHNLAVDTIRQRARRQTDLPGMDVLAEVADDAPDQEEITVGRERLTQLAASLDGLPPRTRDIFILNRVDGLSYREVAAKLNISESSVQKHLARALLHVTTNLRDRSRTQ
ncbi:RNA polymerase sigma factor [Labrenzia sp. CE80]|uniref:RNA polymerase sigma factor n=1 Tax=Labrenzia sp. CE80 TaxID=1788986 RepID=UPI00129AE736|nr:RNA polymerase sigma factor [Labrenzia sp. CE80]